MRLGDQKVITFKMLGDECRGEKERVNPNELKLNSQKEKSRYPLALTIANFTFGY